MGLRWRLQETCWAGAAKRMRAPTPHAPPVRAWRDPALVPASAPVVGGKAGWETLMMPITCPGCYEEEPLKLMCSLRELAIRVLTRPSAHNLSPTHPQDSTRSTVKTSSVLHAFHPQSPPCPSSWRGSFQPASTYARCTHLTCHLQRLCLGLGRATMLPFPGSPGATWASYKTHISASLASHTFRTFVAFWMLGLINNVLYVIILSAAVDLVGSSVPIGLVLLADVFPSFITKLIAPYCIHVVPYGVRVTAFVAISACGMLLVATSPDAQDASTVALKLFGVALASVSSGGGELSFLGLTHFYPRISLAAWGSGTGGAGLVGAGAYVLATTSFGLTSKTTLLAFSFLPVFMLLSYFVILPTQSSSDVLYRALPEPVAEDSAVHTSPTTLDDHDSLLGQAPPSFGSPWQALHANLLRARKLFLPYMLPLLLVYVAEYTINQGVAPTLLFPLRETPFHHFRDFYPAYNAIYQVGVFISRSSIAFLRVHHLYAPSCLQILNLALLTAHSLFGILGNVWVIFLVVFWEGLLGGLVYVNTFAEITENVPPEDREFSLSATTVSDSGGICIAALLSMGFETYLCDWQVARGQDYCRMSI
ncbi:hypothetical protein FH972_001624 [Carpinus fangiana]|uniref:Protein BTN n=1 Tax=Carpinus fangiana TaxID=176857 RepID=A0A5N6QCC9_9ROSI|nr:hypothetical protein FH972_001624 [Carpinus fangiana]